MHEGRIPSEGIELMTYGVTQEEAARFGLPCGGTLRLVQEPLGDPQWIADMLKRCDNHELVARQLELGTGRVQLFPAQADETLHLDGQTLRVVYGPRWRLLLIGAGQLSRYVSEMAHMLDFDVLICDPRQEFNHGWESSKARFVPGMPDDAVLAIVPDERTAIVALTHDPRLDDMALLTALKSSAFYVGALGSMGNSNKRRERLALFDLTEDEIERLHGPIGLHIGSHTPAEIAVSLLAEVVAVKNGVALTQKKQAKNPIEQVA
jgi:xanthine dehydrogenase accessory factor